MIGNTKIYLTQHWGEALSSAEASSVEKGPVSTARSPRAFFSLLPSSRALYFPFPYSPAYRKDERDLCGGGDERAAHICKWIVVLSQVFQLNVTAIVVSWLLELKTRAYGITLELAIT